ncbi:MAG: hypothetical protein IJY56_01955 [Clostridia bacterium]|nr:hypothetical protein [Clostridia bacterium]
MNSVKASVVRFKDKDAMPLVYEADVTKVPYSADNTGKEDVTEAIRQALLDVSAAGGGTVFLPEGEYRLTGELTVPAQVCLAGEPEKTVISVDNEMFGDETTSALISLSGNSGISGLTFWYPRQNLANPITYQYAVKSCGSMCCVIDCNFINAYNGIMSHGPNGICTYRNIRGTCLHNALYSGDESDICIYENISFSPEFWAKSDKKYLPPKEDEIREVMAKNHSKGFVVGALERVEMNDITLDGYDIGLHNFNARRVWFSASIYGLEITDSRVGMMFEKTDNRYGVNFANCRIEGREAAVINNTDGWLKFADSKIKGDVISADGMFFSTHPDAPKVKKPSLDPEIPKCVLYDLVEDYNADNTGETPMSTLIQDVLDIADKKGGGIVYLPAGIYLLDKPLRVPANTQLRGSVGLPVSIGKDLTGTSLRIEFGKDDPDAPPAITLAGKNAGLYSLRIYYPDNGVTTDPDFKLHTYPYTVKGEAKGVYVKYVSLFAASNAVWMDNADGFIVDRLIGCIYNNTVNVTNCKNGVINGIQQNGHYCTGAANCGVPGTALWLKDTVYRIIDDYITPNLTMIKADNACKLVVYNSFFYGGQRFLDVKDTDVVTVNTESARSGGANNRHGVYAGEVEALLINTIRPRLEWIEDRAASDLELTMINRCGAHQLTDDYTVTKKRNEQKKFLGIF